MIRILFFLLLPLGAMAQTTRCDTLAHDIIIYREISQIQERAIKGLQRQVSDLKARADLSDRAIKDLEVRANQEIAQTHQQYRGYAKPPSRWQRLKTGARTFTAGVGAGILLILLL